MDLKGPTSKKKRRKMGEKRKEREKEGKKVRRKRNCCSIIAVPSERSNSGYPLGSLLISH